MIELSNEIEAEYVFSKSKCDVLTDKWLETYNTMANCIEQYRREIANNIFIKAHKDPIPRDIIDKLWVWEKHLHLRGTLHQRLLQILESNL